jgi:hypothetical protein
MKVLDKQVAGDHYKKMAIQPVEFIVKNNIPFLEASAIKYICRHKDKGGLADIEKAMHFLEMIIEYNYTKEDKMACKGKKKPKK